MDRFKKFNKIELFNELKYFDEIKHLQTLVENMAKTNRSVTTTTC